jgi:hypothetical protein
MPLLLQTRGKNHIHGKNMEIMLDESIAYIMLKVPRIMLEPCTAYNCESTAYINGESTAYNGKSTRYDGESTAYNAESTAYNAKAPPYIMLKAPNKMPFDNFKPAKSIKEDQR